MAGAAGQVAVTLSVPGRTGIGIEVCDEANKRPLVYLRRCCRNTGPLL